MPGIEKHIADVLLQLATTGTDHIPLLCITPSFARKSKSVLGMCMLKT